MRIGIVGAENSHTLAVAKTLNLEQACGDARVVAVWGETRELAEKAAADGQIPSIVDKPEDMIGKIDGVMVDHRHAKYHIPAATPFIKAGIPAFVDKPFSYTVKEGWDLIKLARKKKVALTSFSVLPEQSSFRDDMMKQVQAAGKITAVYTTGPVDLKSQYGGVFFYGIHQVGMILAAFGRGIESVQIVPATKPNTNAVAILKYAKGGPIVSMLCIHEGQAPFTFRAVGDKAVVDYVYKSDPNQYLNGIKKFVDMFRTDNQPYSPRQMLEPIAVLAAMDKSVKSGGKPVKVQKLPAGV